MYGKFVLRKKDEEGNYGLEVIKPEESLRSAIFGESLHCSIKFPIYRDLSVLFCRVFDTLADQEVEVLKYRFGFYGKFHSLREAGRIMGLSGERVRQIEKKALRKMRHPSRSRCLWRVTKWEDVLQTEEEIVDFKKIIIAKIEAYISGHDSKVGFLKDILGRNELAIDLGNGIAGMGAEKILLEDLGFDVRTYNCMKRVGAKTMADLLGYTKEDLLKVRNLGRKSAEKVLEAIRLYKTGEIRVNVNNVSANKYVSVRISYKGNEQVYKFGRMSKAEISECIYEVLTEEYSPKGTIIDYEMSMELKFLLLFKGYFFVENIIQDCELIGSEFLAVGHRKYADEFKEMVKRLKDCFDNELNPEVAFVIVKNKAVRNIIKCNPKNRDELFGCFKTGNAENDETLKEMFDRNFPLHFKIDVSEGISLNEIEENDILESEDEQISTIVDSEEEWESFE